MLELNAVPGLRIIRLQAPPASQRMPSERNITRFFQTDVSLQSYDLMGATYQEE